MENKWLSSILFKQMPGYKIDRFIDLTEGLKKHLTCTLCQQIFKNAVKSECDHTFCKECIQQWVGLTRKCPGCEHRFSMKRSNDSRDERNVVIISNYVFKSHQIIDNMINDLKIKCDFEFNGCKHIIELASLQSHINECQYKKCFCSVDGLTEPHNCADNLWKRVFWFSDQNKELTRQFIIKDREINDWKKKYETLLTQFTEQQKECETKDEKIEEWEEKYDQLFDENKELTRQIDIKDQEINEWEEKYETIRDEYIDEQNESETKDEKIEELEQKFDEIFAKYSENTSIKTEINQKLKDIFQMFSNFWGRELFISKLYIGNVECCYSRSTPNPDNIKFTIDSEMIAFKNVISNNRITKTQDISVNLKNIQNFYYCFGDKLRAHVLRLDTHCCQSINEILNLGESHEFDVNAKGIEISE